MPRIERVLETALYVEDISRAVDFYQRVLGFGVLARSGEPERLAAMDMGGVHVLLLFKAGATANDVNIPGGRIPGFDGSGNGHVAFPIAAEELDAWEKQLAEKGIAIESTVKWERGGQSIYFRDPDGNLLELATPGVWATY
ncbi:MAG TPA: VOC family protein [Candidatus Dormibacteraeota bacterium]|jgi:catechol 2,3-dioxygenase-like lactoylglutathione lyase family enzyme|nr:VOC family protein [Candidatus Dormibacteraeota bacterium]